MLDTNHIIKFNPKLWIMGLFFMGIIPFFIWAKYSEIDQIAHASGTVIANAKTQEIQTANEGVIEEILVQEGQKVKKGDVLCIVEAMKLMNEIESEFDGEIKEILVQDGEAVEYGKPLFKIKK